MKMSQSLFEIVRNGFKTVVENNGGAAIVVDSYKREGHTCKRMLWDIFWALNFDCRYDDNHPAYQDGTCVDFNPQTQTYSEPKPRPARKRILPYQPTFGPEVDDLDGSHIETALKKIGKELGMIYELEAVTT